MKNTISIKKSKGSVTITANGSSAMALFRAMEKATEKKKDAQSDAARSQEGAR